MFQIMFKDSLRLFLRRHIIRASIEREQLRCLQDCLVEKPRRSKKSWWWILLPIFLTLQLLLHIQENGDIEVVTDATSTVRSNGSSVPAPRTFGRQLVAPTKTTTTKQELEDSWSEFWVLQDAELHTYLLKKKLLENESKNNFTPRPALEITEISITTTSNNSQGFLPVCRVNQNKTGNVTLNWSTYVDLEELYPMVKKGGLYKPADCWSRHKVAVLIPYRNRPRNLKTFLINIHPFLMAQNLEYRIFVVEQYGTSRFNKGRLLNAGFKVLQRLGSWDCVVEHDLDLLPMDHRILYSCPTYPRVLSTAVFLTNGSLFNISNTSLRYGGVTVMSVDHFERVNGHSNLYQGLDLEDYDMYLRLFLHNAMQRYKLEGLSTLEYKVLNITYHHLFTRIILRLDDKPQLRNRKTYSYKPPVYNVKPDLVRRTKKKYPKITTVMGAIRLRTKSLNLN